MTIAFPVWATVKDADPDIPSTVAVTAVVPLATAVTNPEEFTVAALVLVEDQVNVLPEMVLPEPSLATAVNCCVAPIAARDVVAGVTWTELTVGGLGVDGPPEGPVDEESPPQDATNVVTPSAVKTRTTVLRDNISTTK